MGSKVEIRFRYYCIYGLAPLSQIMDLPAEQNLSPTLVASQFYQAAGQNT